MRNRLSGLRLVSTLVWASLVILSFVTSGKTNPRPAAVTEPVFTADSLEQSATQGGAQEKTTEVAFKNIQVLNGLPSSRLMGAMSFFSKSLGVDCTHCHVQNEFDKDDKPAKHTARKMYRMVRLAQNSIENNTVSCYMCHRGHVQPEAPPDAFKPSEEAMRRANEDARPAEQVYKNIQSLKGVPAGRWMIIMNMFSRALGVDCTHCHVQNEFDKDEKPAKQTARKMLRMVGSIAREIYKGPTSINCFTCHRGQPKPVAFPPSEGTTKSESKEPVVVKDGPLPSPQGVLQKNIEAKGGRHALQRIKTRVMTGRLEAQGGFSAPLEIYEKAPNKKLIFFRAIGGDSFVGYDGTIAWSRASETGVRQASGPELEMIRFDAEFNKDLALDRLYEKLAVVGRTRLGDRDCYVIEAMANRGKPDRLYFDVQTGLFVRRDFESRDPEGSRSLQITYEDFKEVDGVKLPFTVRWSRPGFTFIHRLSEIRQNVAIDDSKFIKPSS